MQTEAIASIQEINEEYADLYALDAVVFSNLNQNNTTINTLSDNIAQKLEQLQDETLSIEQIATLRNEISSLQSNMNSLIQYNQNAMQIAETTQLLTADGIEAVNDLINSSETIEVNEQNINEIYLSSIPEGRTQFEPHEMATISAIANQCPY